MKSIIHPSNSNVDAPCSLEAGQRKRTILIVDDDRRFAKSIDEALTIWGFEVFVAHDGNVGLAMAMAKRPDMIVLDSRMPKRSGYLVMEYLKTKTNLCCPVIMLSDNEGERHREYAKMLGAIEFLEKPINSIQLTSTIAKVLEQCPEIRPSAI